MTLLELKKLAQSANIDEPAPWQSKKAGQYSAVTNADGLGVAIDLMPSAAEFIAAMNPATALRMIELLEEASGFIRALNIVPPTKECEQMTAKWLKDLEEL